MTPNSVLLPLILFTPAISMISGLFMAPWMILLLTAMIWFSRSSIELSQITKIPMLEIVIIAYCFLSSFWAIQPLTSVWVALQLTFVLLCSHFVYHYATFLSISPPKLFLMIVLAYLIFFIEVYSGGIITTNIRKIINPKEYRFALYSLDRGCAILSCISWGVLYHLINNRSYILSWMVYFLTLLALFFSDSTSSLLGYIVATLSFILMFITKGKIAFLSRIGMMTVIVMIPVFSSVINPRVVIDHYGEKLHISHTHRLVIWNFVYNKAMEKPILGYGIGNSRFVPVAEEDMVPYVQNDVVGKRDVVLSPLPLHPHNNILQTLLELGIIGVVLLISYIWQLWKKAGDIAREKHDMLWHASATSMLVNYFCIGMISFNMWQSWWILITLFGILILNLKTK